MTTPSMVVVMLSGGIASWEAGRRTLERFRGQCPVVGLFTDTKIEDEDLYRFLDEGASAIGLPLVKIADGRTPWEVFDDAKFIGNTMIDPCSRVLKREIAREWVERNCPPDTMIVLGLDWTEEHRLAAPTERWLPYQVWAPLTERPLFDRKRTMRALELKGVAVPRLYGMGFQHNNCGGFCVKQGQGGFKRLLETMPERYRYHEEQEKAWREKHGKDVAILRDRRKVDGKKSTLPMTLEAFRLRVEAGKKVDDQEWGGCGCFA